MNSFLVAVVMVIGLVGVVVPFLPGTGLILAAGIGWAWLVQDNAADAWVAVTLMTLLFIAGALAKYVLPGRVLAGRFDRSTLWAGLIGALVGLVVFFPLGFLIGGVLAIYAWEAWRLKSPSQAWPATLEVLKAIGLGVLAELAAAVLMIAVWLAALVIT